MLYSSHKDFLWICILFVLSSAGCVTRALVIDTTPPGAQVYVDDQLVGESPVRVKFVHYGVRKITMEKRDKEGKLIYERKIVYADVQPPFYQRFPLDFASDVVIPVNIKDEHVLNFQLEPKKFRPSKEVREEMVKDAEELRKRAFEPEVIEKGRLERLYDIPKELKP